MGGESLLAWQNRQMGLLSGKDRPRSRFYTSLATGIDAGLGVVQSLDLVTEEPFSTPGEKLREAVARGDSLAAAMSRHSAFSSFEIRAVEAGEAGGRTVDILRRLAAFFEERRRARDRLGLTLLYPVILLHAAIFLPPLFILFRDGALAYLAAVAPPLLGAYALVVLGVYLSRVLLADAARRRGAERLVWGLPFVGTVVHGRALADYAYMSGTLVASGLPVLRALSVSAQASRSALLRDAGRRVAESVERGDTLWGAVSRESEAFPRLFVETVKTGEIAGRLDDALERAERTCREEAATAQERLNLVLPVLALAAAGAVVAWVAVRFLKTFVGGGP